MKTATKYVCNNCEFETPKWIGKCPNCNSWNSFEEQQIQPKIQQKRVQGISHKPNSISSSISSRDRYKTEISELDNVLGGGIINDSLILLSGEPGIGKSTLTLQICDKIASLKKKVLYISGEESVSQIGNRALRLNISSELISIVNENYLENILATLENENPDFIVIDSIQVITSNNSTSLSGSISQIRQVTEQLMEYAKRHGKAMLIIGHITKDGNLAGPKTLEHLVDVVIHLEGERYQNLRILRGLKNRFGPTSEIGIFEMAQTGLIEINNPSEKILEERPKNSIGSALSITVEGLRPFIIEIQALTNPTIFGYPKRTSSGFDVNRLNLLIAVIQKYTGINLSSQDVYVNVIGGLKIKDPAVDLAVVCSIISSYNKTPLPMNAVYFGEVGLSGEIRKVLHEEKRRKEVEKLGLDLKNYKQIKEIQNSSMDTSF